MARMNFPAALASGQVPGVTAGRFALERNGCIDDCARLCWDMTRQRKRWQRDRKRVCEGKDPAPSLIASLVLSSPDFERR